MLDRGVWAGHSLTQAWSAGQSQKDILRQEGERSWLPGSAVPRGMGLGHCVLLTVCLPSDSDLALPGLGQG